MGQRGQILHFAIGASDLREGVGLPHHSASPRGSLAKHFVLLLARHIFSLHEKMEHPSGVEPEFPASEADALSIELRVQSQAGQCPEAD